MAVSRLSAPAVLVRLRIVEGETRRRLLRPRRIGRIFRADLPADVNEAEYSVALLFRASLVLNVLTGGHEDMTFSARCHVQGRRARSRPGRLFWRFTAGLIDASCGVLRGESEHCATAWSNFVARDRRGD